MNTGDILFSDKKNWENVQAYKHLNQLYKHTFLSLKF